MSILLAVQRPVNFSGSFSARRSSTPSSNTAVNWQHDDVCFRFSAARKQEAVPQGQQRLQQQSSDLFCQ